MANAEINEPHIVWEHSIRNEVRSVVATLERALVEDHQTLYVTCRYDSTVNNGEWSIHTWGAGTKDATTRGAVLRDVMQEHIKRVGKDAVLATLPALLSAPTPITVEDDAAVADDGSGADDEQF